MPKSGKQGNSKGTSGKHLGGEKTAAFLLYSYFVGVMAGRSSQKMDKWTDLAALGRRVGGRRTDGNTVPRYM